MATLTPEMEFLMALVKGWNLLTIVTKNPI